MTLVRAIVKKVSGAASFKNLTRAAAYGFLDTIEGKREAYQKEIAKLEAQDAKRKATREAFDKLPVLGKVSFIDANGKDRQYDAKLMDGKVFIKTCGFKVRNLDNHLSREIVGAKKVVKSWEKKA